MKLLVALIVMLLADPATQPGDASGHWEGEIKVPGSGLVVMVDLSRDGNVWSGSIDIPAQGAAEVPLESVSVVDASVKFTITGVPGKPSFDGKLDGAKLEGTFTQSGRSIPFALSREKVKPKLRPQDPVPPLPYREEEVSFGHGDVKLAGTLSLPQVKGTRPFVSVVLVSGSGPQNRDEELLNHRPFRVISDRLCRAGIAVLRYDDRGTAKSTGKFDGATTADFCDDALSAVAFLKTRSEIDASHIGIVGHSEGGLIAPMAANKSGDVAFIVLLAGTGVSGDELLAKQMEMGLRAEGISEESIAKQVPLQKRLIEAVVNKEPAEIINDVMKQLAEVQDKSQLAGMKPEEISELIDSQAKALTTPWMHYFLTHDPRPDLRKVKVPVLAINGEKDFQVPPSQNLPEIEKALKEAGNSDVTIKELPGLNHLFQHCTTGGISEYAKIDETFSEEAMKLVADWVLARAKK